MSIAEDAAAIYDDPTLTDEERIAALEALRVVGFAAIVLPFIAGARTITALDWSGSILTIDGDGDLDWPVRVVNLPFLIPDELGLIVRDESPFTFSPQGVISEIVSGL